MTFNFLCNQRELKKYLEFLLMLHTQLPKANLGWVVWSHESPWDTGLLLQFVGGGPFRKGWGLVADVKDVEEAP